MHTQLALLTWSILEESIINYKVVDLWHLLVEVVMLVKECHKLVRRLIHSHVPSQYTLVLFGEYQ